MNFIARHKTASAFTALYLLAWCCLFYIVFTVLGKDPQCATGLIVLISLFYLLTAVFLAGFLITYFISKKAGKTDYLWFIAVIVLPPLIGGFWFGVL